VRRPLGKEPAEEIPMSVSPKDPTLPVDDESRALARQLLRTSRSGALATNDCTSGMPFASLVAVATEIDGSPIILTSQLSTHTQLLDADSRCSLLVAAIGRGDPLAHPRLTILAKARKLAPGQPDTAQARRRYLALHPKAILYVDFPDFAFWRLDIVSASLNGGFGRAYRMSAADILLRTPALDEFAAMEPDAIAHMNADHAEAVGLYATRLCGGKPGNWSITSIDPEGALLTSGETVLRMKFPHTLQATDELRPMLIALAKQARNLPGA
jgi:putative heme iron utilization protein